MAPAVSAIRAWLGDLASSPGGPSFLRHLRGEAGLPRLSRGTSSLERLIAGIEEWSRTPSRPPAVKWLEGYLNGSGNHCLCQGRDVPDSPSTDSVCRMTSLNDVLKYYATREARTNAGVVAAATLPATDRARLRHWGHTFLESPALAATVIEPTAAVRGKLPLNFATPEVDRRKHWPPGTPPRRIFQLLGLEYVATDQCALTFRQTAAGRGRVPTALDAFTHPHFLPSPWNARWGATLDLLTPAARRKGVRECVLQPFHARHVTRYDVIDV